MKIRQGNPFTLNWKILVNEGDIPLSDLNITIEITNPIGQKFYPSFIVEEDHISIPISTKHQKWTGMYHLTCYHDKDKDSQRVVDDIDAFEIVDKAEENIEAVTVVEVGVSRLYYNVGGMSAYEIAVMHGFDGTEGDWLESLHQPAKDAAEDIAEMQQQADAALADVVESREEINSLNEQSNELLKKLENADVIIKETEEAAEEARNAAAEAGLVADKLDEINQAIVDANTAATDAKAAQTTIESNIDELQETAASIQKSIDEVDATLEKAENIQEAIDTLEDALNNAQTAIDRVDEFLETSENIVYKEDIEGVATEEWVQQQGYLTEQNLSGYATEEWVQNQEYLTEHQSLAGYATQTWVEGKNYLTSVPSEYITESELKAKEYATKSEIPSLTGYATESWVTGKNYLTSVPSEYITESELTAKRLASESWVENKNYLTYVPSEYVTESKLSDKGYITAKWVEDKNYLTSVPDVYVTQSQLESKRYVNETWVESKKYLTYIPSDYVTESELSGKGFALKSEIPSLDGYAKTEDIPSLEGYAKSEDIPAPYDDTDVKNRLTTLEAIDHSKYLTEHQDLSSYALKSEIPSLAGYATEEWVNSTINNLPEGGILVEEDPVFLNWIKSNQVAYVGDIPSLDGYAKTDEIPSLAGYATEEWVEGKNYLTTYTDTIYDDTDVKNRLTTLEAIDHSKYATTDWVAAQSYLTKHQDLSSYALKSEIPSLAGYATEEWVEGKNYLTTYTDTIYDDTDVKNRLTTLEAIDHSKYLTEHQDLSSYALKSEIPSLAGYATEEWVNSTINNLPEGGILVEEDPVFLNWIKSNQVAYVGDIPSLDGYAKTDEIPSLAGYATEEWVEGKNYLTTYTDTIYDDTVLSNRVAALEEIDHSKYLTEHQSLAGYATEEWVEGKNYLTTYTDTIYDDTDVKNRLNTLESIDHSKYLTEHQDLSSYALKSEIPSLAGYATESWVTNQLNSLPEGGIQVETDPVFTNWLSSNEVAYVGDIPEQYDDTNVKNRLTTLEAIDHSKYLTEHQDLSSYALKSEIPSLAGYATESWVESKNYLTTYTDTIYDDTDVKNRLTTLEAIDHTQYALVSQIPSTDNLATKTELTSYATKTAVNAMFVYDESTKTLTINQL